MKKDTVKWFAILLVIILIISLGGIASKSAAKFEMLSFDWILRYGILIGILGFYAIAWQQVIKHLPLITSYANKAATTIWGLVWGYTIFGEKITLLKIIGAAVVIAGVYLVVTGDDEITNKNDDVKEVEKNA